MSGFRTTLYNIFLKRSSTYVITIIGGTFIFERTFDLASNKLFESINKGVSKNYKLMLMLLIMLAFRNYGKTSNTSMKQTEWMD
ncbi:hypothetical protein M0804_001800 [Polistes exclamans]|nr:hypothetical protein M0804_001800 [Polistes exclamans]